MTDMNVVNLVYVSAKKAGANDFIMLALFEACIVESGFTNPQTATDHDSIGVLQQRPSAGWPNPGDVPTAVNSFVSRAKTKGQSGTAGQLAQSVQVSAFPLRYDAVKVQAATLIGTAAKNAGDVNASNVDALIAKFKALVGSGASAATDAASIVPSWVTDVGKFFEKLTSVKTWIRFGYFVIGGAFIIFGIFKLTGDNKLSPVTKAAVAFVPGAGVVAKVARGASVASTVKGMSKRG